MGFIMCVKHVLTFTLIKGTVMWQLIIVMSTGAAFLLVAACTQAKPVNPLFGV